MSLKGLAQLIVNFVMVAGKACHGFSSHPSFEQHQVRLFLSGSVVFIPATTCLVSGKVVTGQCLDKGILTFYLYIRLVGFQSST